MTTLKPHATKRTKHPILKRTCRKCKRELIASHFRYDRKSCRTCLDGIAYPSDDAVLLIPSPRATLRHWPAFVVDHAPAPDYRGKPCPQCGESFTHKRKNQRFCSKKCRQTYTLWAYRERKWRAKRAKHADAPADAPQHPAVLYADEDGQDDDQY